MTDEEFDQQVEALFHAIDARTGSPVVDLEGFYQIAGDDETLIAETRALAAEHGVSLTWHESLIAGTSVVGLVLPASLA